MTENPDVASRPIGTLRNARAEVDVRRAGRFIAGLCVVTLAVLVVAFTIVGAHKNAQINELHEQGIPAQVVVSHCLGLMGGSGSNSAGYACRGTFSVDGTRYDVAIPGNVLRVPGSRVRIVTVPRDPALITTAQALPGEHSSWRVFIAPGALFVAFAVVLAWLVLRRRRLARS